MFSPSDGFPSKVMQVGPLLATNADIAPINGPILYMGNWSYKPDNWSHSPTYS